MWWYNEVSKAFERYLDHECQALTAWDWYPYKRHPRQLSLSFCHVRVRQEDGLLWSRKQVLTKYWIFLAPDLGPSRTMRSFCCLSHPLYGICYNSPSKLIYPSPTIINICQDYFILITHAHFLNSRMLSKQILDRYAILLTTILFNISN